MTAKIEQVEKIELSKIEAEHYEEIVRLQRECDVLESKYETEKARADTAKKEWQEAEAEKSAAIRRGPNKQMTLPFKKDWRLTPVEKALKLSGKQLERLHESGIKTVEEFEKVRGGPGGLRSIKGVGQATVDKWENEILDWVGANRPKDDVPPPGKPSKEQKPEDRVLDASKAAKPKPGKPTKAKKKGWGASANSKA